MANYTITIREYLQLSYPEKQYFHENTDEPIMAELINTVNAVIPEYGLNLLKESNRQAFALMFLLHYFNNEIGFPSVRLFKTALIGKLVQYHTYIDSAFDLVADGLFTSKMSTKSTSSNAGLNHSETGGTSTTTGDAGTMHTHQSGSNTGATTNTNTSDSHNGSFNTTTSTPQGSTITSVENKPSTTTNGAHRDSHWNQFSDTPQNGLSDVRNGTYLTNATYTEDNIGESTNKTTGGGSTTTVTHNGDKVVTTSEDDYTRTHGHTETSAKGSDSSNSTSDVTTEQERKSESVTKYNSTTDNKNSGSSNGTSESLVYSYDSLMGALPLIDFIWPLFDDLFMQIYDEFYF